MDIRVELALVISVNERNPWSQRRLRRQQRLAGFAAPRVVAHGKPSTPEPACRALVHHDVHLRPTVRFHTETTVAKHVSAWEPGGRRIISGNRRPEHAVVGARQSRQTSLEGCRYPSCRARRVADSHKDQASAVCGCQVRCTLHLNVPIVGNSPPAAQAAIASRGRLAPRRVAPSPSISARQLSCGCNCSRRAAASVLTACRLASSCRHVCSNAVLLEDLEHEAACDRVQQIVVQVQEHPLRGWLRHRSLQQPLGQHASFANLVVRRCARRDPAISPPLAPKTTAAALRL